MLTDTVLSVSLLQNLKNFHFMKDESKKEGAAPTPNQVAEWVRRDLDNAIAFLNMLRNDPQIIAAVVDIVNEKVALREEEKKVNPELNFNGRQ